MATSTIPELSLFWRYVTHWARVRPDRVAVEDGENLVTYRELDDLSSQLSRALARRGVRKGDRVVSVLPAGLDYVVLLVAAAKSGAILAPLDPRYKRADLERFLTLADPKVVISVTEFEGNRVAETLAESCRRRRGVEFLLTEEEPAPPFSSFQSLLLPKLEGDDRSFAGLSLQNPEDPCLLIFTGGTTSEPKGALLSHRNVISTTLLEYTEVLAHVSRTPEKNFAQLAALPPSHIGGSVEVIGGGLIAGVTLVTLPRWSPYEMLRVTAERKAPVLAGVPAMYTILLSLPDLEDFDLSSVEVAVISGDHVSVGLVRDIRERICPNLLVSYGATEANVLSFTEPDVSAEALDRGFVGKPLSGVRFKIQGEKGEDLPEGESGEILVRGPSVISEYFQSPEETAASFDERDFFRTGDLGYLDENGGLYVRGRKKQTIRVGSYTVLPAEVEHVALAHTEVLETAAVGMPDGVLGEVVWLFASLKPGSDLTEQTLIEFFSDELADFKIPRRVVFVREMPLTRIGKIDKRALTKIAREKVIL